MKNKPIFYDSDCLVSFLVIGEYSILQKMFSKIIIPSPVYEELSNESTPDIIKDNLRLLINNGFVEIKNIDIMSEEYWKYDCIKNGRWTDKFMGKGEASIIACAIVNEGIVASNNLSDIMDLAREYDLAILTSSLILGIAFEKNLIDEEKADNIWNKMLNKRIMLPEASFSEYYQLKYNSDFDDFFKLKDSLIK